MRQQSLVASKSHLWLSRHAVGLLNAERANVTVLLSLNKTISNLSVHWNIVKIQYCNIRWNFNRLFHTSVINHETQINISLSVSAKYLISMPPKTFFHHFTVLENILNQKQKAECVFHEWCRNTFDTFFVGSTSKITSALFIIKSNSYSICPWS